MSLAVVSPQSTEPLSSRAGAMGSTIPYYSTEMCNLSEDMDFLRSDNAIAGIVACQFVGDEVDMAARAHLDHRHFAACGSLRIRF